MLTHISEILATKLLKRCRILRFLSEADRRAGASTVVAALLLDSTDTETDVTDNFAAEALFLFAQDFGLRDLFELVVKRGLKDADVEHTFAQRHRNGVRAAMKPPTIFDLVSITSASRKPRRSSNRLPDFENSRVVM